MPNRENEEADLAAADRHIAEAEERIAELESRIEASVATGLETGDSNKLLAVMVETLNAMKAHRDTIINVIRSIDDGTLPSIK